MATKKTTKPPLSVETLKHDDATRKNIPTAEYQSVMATDEQTESERNLLRPHEQALHRIRVAGRRRPDHLGVARALGLADRRMHVFLFRHRHGCFSSDCNRRHLCRSPESLD